MDKRLIWTLVASLALTTAPFAAGCGDDDDNGGGTGPTPNQNIPREFAEEQAEGAVEFANSLLATIDDLSQLSSEDDFSGLGNGFFFFKRAAEPVETTTYANGRWTHTYVDEIVEGSFSSSIDLEVTLQFLDQMSAPQQFPGETTNAMNYGVDAAFAFGSSFTDTETNETTTVATDIDYLGNMSVTGFLQADLDVVGTGTQQISFVSNSPDGNVNFLIAMTWDIDVEVPQNGACPTGTIGITFGQYSITVTYNGTSLASWVLRDNGVTIANGSEGLFCGQPVGASN